MARTIEVDDREPDLVAQGFRDRFDDYDVSVKRMKSGDIVAPGLNAAVERKTFKDLLDSISDSRIWRQLDKMQQSFDHYCFIIAGSDIDSRTAEAHGGHAQAVRKMYGIVAYVNVNTEKGSAFHIGEDGKFGEAQLVEYAHTFFNQCQRGDD